MHELGLRICLGARRVDIAWLLLRHSMAPVSLGVLLGLAGAVATQRWVTASLYGINHLDEWTFAATPAAICLAALAAIVGPIRRATTSDPVAAMRDA
jgi:ABC-type lipoprotein release transport system permease subunit